MRGNWKGQDRLTLRRIRIALGIFIAGLVLSGLTAFPLLQEIHVVAQMRGIAEASPQDLAPGFDRWIIVVRDGLQATYGRYPWIAYGTDWLAFAHLALAVFFVGPIRDPLRNIWTLWAGLIACAGVIPLALICGALRGIPMGWRFIDCSFGILGSIPLLYCLRLTRRLGGRSGLE